MIRVTAIRGTTVVAMLALLATCGSPAPTGRATLTPERSATPETSPMSSATGSSAPSTPTVTVGPVSAQPSPSPSGPGIDLTTTPLVWFTPLPPLGARTDLPFADGSLDYFDLFAPDAPWATASASVQVFKVYSSWVDNYATDEQLRQVVESAAARGQAIAVEIGALTTHAGCGRGVEGFDASLATLDRIRAMGGTVSLVAFDEPYAFGHAYTGPDACRWPVDRLASEVAGFVEQLRAAWPGILVGDIEPLWSQIGAGQLGEWIDAYRVAAGRPLDFLHLDADWSLADWADRAADAATTARVRGVPAGMIYNGGDASSDRAWNDAARAHADAFEAALGGPPDQVVFQSWMDHPDHVLPDTDPSTFTGLIRQYVGARARIEIGSITTPGHGRLRVGGRLVPTAAGRVAGAIIRLTAIPVDGAYQVSTLEGRVPDGAATAVVALRANTEGAGPGPVHLRLYRLGYAEGANGRNRVPDPWFAAGPERWGVSGSGTARFVASDRGSGRMLRIDAAAGQDVLVDSTAFPVTAGARFRLTAALRVPVSVTGNAYLAVVFLHGTEVERDRLELAPKPIRLGSATTDAAGAFGVGGLRLEPGRYLLRLEDPGSPDRWPTSAETTIRVR